MAAPSASELAQPLRPKGILVKDGRALELMTKSTILFDKTGTLTLERPRSDG
jgi:cation transport ATPase